MCKVKSRTKLTHDKAERHMVVYVGLANNKKHIINKVVNEFQVEIQNKIDWERGNDTSWLIEISSLYY